MGKFLIGIILTSALASPAFADDKSVIQTLDDQWSAAVSRGDAAGVAAMYAKDATILPPDSSVVRGAGIAQFAAGMVAHVSQLKLTAKTVVRLSPNHIQEIGTAAATSKGEKSETSSSTYVVIWRKTGGSWKIITDIFH